MIQAIYGPRLIDSPLPFSPAIRAGDYLFMSGMASADGQGKLVNDSFEGEVRRTYGNVHNVLDAAGIDFSHVVQVRCYLAEQKYWEEHNKLYREFFSEPYPARTTLIGCLGNLVKYEVDLIAYIESPETS